MVEEFVFAIYDDYPVLIARVEEQYTWIVRSLIRVAYEAPGANIVKVYSHDRYKGTVADIEIGYHEQRLSPLARLRLILYVADYWEFPF